MYDSLLELAEGGMQATPTAYACQIECLRRLIDRDDSEHKVQAQQELAYLYHMVNPQSGYANWEEEMRHKRVAEDLFGDAEWTPDEAVEDAMEWYEEQHLTVAQQMLKSTNKSLEKIREHLEDVDFDERNDAGNPIWKPKDVVRIVSKLDDVISSHEGLEERVRKERAEAGANRGGVQTNKYSE